MFSNSRAAFSRTTMYSPSRIPSYASPTRSTPYLDYDTLDYYESPPDDDYLATPDWSEWREIRRLEEEKLRKDTISAAHGSSHYELPALDTLAHDQRPLLSELPPQLPPWPHATIAPKDAFPDYQEVRRFMQEQARPASPSDFSTTSSVCSSHPHVPYTGSELLYPENAFASSESPSSDAQLSPTPSAISSVHLPETPALSRRVGKKSKREEDDEYAPAPKRRMPPPQSIKGNALPQSDDGEESDDGDDNAIDFEDESGDFKPARRLPQPRRKLNSGSRASRPKSARPRPSTAGRPAVKSKSNRGDDYREGPCDCRGEKCTHCQMTCFYTFVHGSRKDNVCRRLFESGRHLDLRRHKATHAVQEWKWLQDDEITADMAHWYSVVFGAKEHGLMCPNGDCTTTFTRYDALKRHMERGTCQFSHLESSKEGLEIRHIKGRIIRESDEKYKRVAAARSTEA